MEIVAAVIIVIVLWPLIKGFLSASKNDQKDWRHDDATERQLDYLRSLGVTSPKGLSKGEASDLITANQPAYEDDLKVIRFFKHSTKGLNRDAAERLAATLLSSQENLNLWNQRPPDVITKEFFKFNSIKLPPKTGYQAAEKLMLEQLKNLPDEQKSNWDSYKSILEELLDKDNRENYDIRKPSLGDIRTGVAGLMSEGKSYDDIYDDIDELIDRMIEINPKLEKK